MNDERKIRVRLRDRVPGDDALIYSSWLRHFAKTSGMVLGDVDAGARRLIDRIMSRPSTRVRVAADAANSDRIHGFCISDPTLRALHFVSIRADSRGGGACRVLVNDAIGEKWSVLRVWHAPRNARFIRRVVALKYDPLLVAEI